MKLIVGKYGSRYVSRSKCRISSKSGEQGETEGLLRFLVEHFGCDSIVYFGRYEGEDLGFPVVEPHTRGLDEFCLEADQRERWEQDIADLDAALGGEQPLAFLMGAGFSATMSFVGNPKGTQVYAAAIRYIAPMLNVLQHYKIPRILINNDPRTYPKDQEMSLGYPYIRPAAILDQTEGDVYTTVGGVRYCRRSIWSKCESWAYHVPRENTREDDCVVIAHAHIKDGCGATIPQKGRAEAWRNVLHGSDVPVYGKGWNHYPYDVNHKGELRPSEVMDVLNKTQTCPCVAQRNFYTGKVYVCVNQGCIPLLYGDGSDEYTWDPRGRFLPLDHDYRIKQPGDLDRVVKDTIDDYEGWLKFWHYACQPNWLALFDIIGDLLQGKVDWRSREWWEKWGGYWPCNGTPNYDEKPHKL